MQQWRRNNPITEILNTIRSRGSSAPPTTTPRVHHIDRIDPADGYHLHNIQLLGGSENIAKGNKEHHSERYQEYLRMREAAKDAGMDCPF